MNAEIIGGVLIGLYVIGREAIPRIVRANKNNSGMSSGDHKRASFDPDKFMTEEQHDKECGLKLKPIWKKLDDIHSDVKVIKRNGGG